MLQEVYEHPVKTGAAVAAVAAGGAALVYAARKGHLGELMPWKKPNVLIIEDTKGMGLAFQDALKASGHETTWVTSIKSLKPLTGISPEGAEVSLASKRFKVALVDGDLGKGQLTGPEIVGTLKSNRIFSIGTSTTDEFNKAMLENGAQVAANKGVIYTSLLGRQIDLKAALRSPQAAQDGLTSFAAVMRKPEWAKLKEEADAKLMHFLLGK